MTNLVDRFRELIAAASADRLEWVLKKHGRIRHWWTDQCPLEALAGLPAGILGSILVEDQVAPFGLSDTEYGLVIAAADDCPEPGMDITELRAVMLAQIQKQVRGA